MNFAYLSSQLDNTVRLDEGNLRTSRNLVDGSLVKLSGVSLQLSELVGVLESRRSGSSLRLGLSVKAASPSLVGLKVCGGGIGLEDNDVAALNNITILELRDGSWSSEDTGEGKKGNSRENDILEELHDEGQALEVGPLGSLELGGWRSKLSGKV